MVKVFCFIFVFVFFFFNDTATTEIYTLSLHDALPIWMNADAVRASLREGRAVYWSRSRQSLWIKGETSGHIQDVVSVEIDCDQDAVLLHVRQTGGACHTGRKSCFYRIIDPETFRLKSE